jgi:hypothetical protein
MERPLEFYDGEMAEIKNKTEKEFDSIDKITVKATLPLHKPFKTLVKKIKKYLKWN